MLNFAKLEAGQVAYELAEVSLAPVVDEVGVMLEPQFAAQQLNYAASVSPDIVVRADPDKLRQILLNLLSNAIKFTEPGGRVVVEAVARDGAPDDAVLLRVSDTGIGIAPDKRDAIFDPFVQVHRDLTRSSTEGMGLGLAISRDLARGMGGDLRVRSVEGEGSTFTLSLPAGGG